MASGDGRPASSGAAPICPDCHTDVRNTHDVKVSGAGFYIGTTCNGGPYSRESEYYLTRRMAQLALDCGTFGR